MTDAAVFAEVNRLYWETDTSVAGIAERFDLSRRALYDVVSPLPADAGCLACGGRLHYENRSARRDRVATCPECGAAAAIGDPAVPGERDSGIDLPADRDLRADARTTADAEDIRGTDLRSRAVLLGGAAIAGVAVGTVAALLARRRT